MPSLGSGLSLGVLNSLPGYDFDVSSFIQQTEISSSTAIKDYTGVTAPYFIPNVRLQGTATGLTLSAVEDFTLAGWINLLYITSANPAFLFGFGNSFKVYIISNGSSKFLTFEYGSTNLTYTLPVFVGEWFHVAVTSTRSGSQSHKMYVNGSLVTTITTTITQTLSSPTFYIGGGGSTEYGQGFIADEVCFFKRQLLASEISLLYGSGDGISYTEASSLLSLASIYSWYSLSETTGNRLNSVDSSVCPLSSNGGGTISNLTGFVAPKVTINPRKQINDFVLQVKSLGLWNSVLFWPSRSFQNKASGTILYGLGGMGAYNAEISSNAKRKDVGISFDLATGGVLSNNSLAPLVRANGGYGCVVVATTPNKGTFNFGVLKGGGGNQIGDNYVISTIEYNSLQQAQSSLTGGNAVRSFGSLGMASQGFNFLGSSRTGLNAPATDTGYVKLNATTNSTLSGTGNLPSVNAYADVFFIAGSGSDGTTYSFSLVSTPMTTTNMESIRTAYKSTLGYGLNMP